MLLLFLVLWSCRSKHEARETDSTGEEDVYIEELVAEARDTIPIINFPFCTQPDQKVKDPVLANFLNLLKRAVERKDTVQLLSLMDEDVITSYGGGVVGYDDFLETWRQRDHHLWKTLSKIMNYGGIQEDDSIYRIPYFSNLGSCSISKDLNERIDWYITWFTAADTAYLYEKPTIHSQVKAKLVASLVNCWEPGKVQNGFLICETLDGKIKGFILEEQMYRLGGYDLIIEKMPSGKWSIAAFAPFD